jgi:hypothetical protein
VGVKPKLLRRVSSTVPGKAISPPERVKLRKNGRRALGSMQAFYESDKDFTPARGEKFAGG